MLDGVHIQVVRSIDDRVQNILREYFDAIPEERMLRETRSSLDVIKKRLGPERHKELSILLGEKNYAEFTRRLLLEYYDKSYALSRAPAEFYHAQISTAGEWEIIDKLLGN